MSKIRTVFFCLILCACILGVAISGYKIGTLTRSSQVAKRSYASLRQYCSISPPADEPTQEPRPSPAGTVSKEDESIWPTVDFFSLQEINPDVVGWLYCPDTPINYPIVQGQDNEYYLHRLFDRTPNQAGSLFLDCRNALDFSDSHTIVYGHHRKDGIMFSSLVEYEDPAYYQAHPELFLLTPTGNYTITLFAGYVAAADENAWQLDFPSEAEYLAWLQAAQARSCFQGPVAPAEEDRIITLSTCSYAFAQARFVLLGILTPCSD